MFVSTEKPEPLWVAAVALISGGGRVLMQQRPAGAVHGTLWELPGGKLESGEAPEAAAVRELSEELRVRVEPSDLIPAGFASGATAGARPVRPLVILLFACRRWLGSPEARAAERLAWYLPDDLAGLSMPPLDYPLAKGLVTLLRAGAL